MTVAQLRPVAEEDLVERTQYYRGQGGDQLGRRFLDTALNALRAIERMPGIGSPRVGELSDIPGLRWFRITGFPRGWFYLDRTDRLDVVRLLAYAPDLSSLLPDQESGPRAG